MTAINTRLTVPAIDPADLPEKKGTIYPDQFKAPCEERLAQVVGTPLGLSQFGVNIVTLPPGCWSAHRHWHETEDEFVYVIEGEISLVTDDGKQVLGAGAVAGFPAATPDGHHLINESDKPARYLVVGTKVKEDHVVYPDVDLVLERKEGRIIFSNRAGERL